ncbi:hypothetical protein [Helicobacter vulpis]|uniref:hypothetical protein n=1 Tax=Helicobacter vulpis TaxID=2316076 RepID=UPI000EB52913|nr:hypothetical protein [Helicobacter vulpis]
MALKQFAKKVLVGAFNGVCGDKVAGLDNEKTRLAWLESTLLKIPRGSRLLDTGAGELAQKKFCAHLNYVAQDFG